MFQMSYNMNSPMHTSDQSQLFIRDKQAWENAIGVYNGNDPLELWYNYICWYDYNIQIDPENKFRETLEKCLSIFEHNEEYKQDIRVVKLWVKYIDLQPNPLNLYQILYQRGIGTQCACFYIGWAHYYDSAGAFKQAESVYNLGFQAKAEPYNDIQEAHTKFRLSVSQRMLYDDSSSKKRSASHLNEQRQQITTLTPPNKKTRTEMNDDCVEPELQQNHQLNQSQQMNLQHQSAQSNNSYRNNNVIKESEQCNLKNSAYVISSSLNFIYDDTNISLQDDNQPTIEYTLENVILPANFSRSARNNHETWKPLLFLEEPFDANRRCMYQKDLVYPGEDIEYSPEEIRSRKWSKKIQELKQQQQNKQKDDEQNNYNVQNIKTKTTSSYAVQNSINSNIQKNHIEDMNEDFEEQIEASTIRFSTDSNGSTKNKTITIKFRREKPGGNYSTSPQNNNYAVVETKQDHVTDQESENHTKYDDEYHSEINIEAHNTSAANHNVPSRYTPSSSDGKIRNLSAITPKPKKVKKIKIVNNYDDPKYTASATTSNNSSDYYNQTHKVNSLSSSSSVSRNQFEDANLLLSIANMHSNDGNTNAQSKITSTTETLAYNDDSLSNADFNSSYHDNNSYLSVSNCSTPIRKLSQSNSKIPHYRTLKKHTSNLSIQNDDSMCSYEQNSFFASEHDDELKQKRMDKALNTIHIHLGKEAIDPFNTELCKAFLTKINFPSRETNDVYKLINNPIPKLANTKATTLADVTYNIEKEVGRGSYGSVFKAVNSQNGSIVALKFQKPPNTWEVYICMEVRKRIVNYDVLAGFMDISAAVIAPNASVLITEFSPYGSLLDINNKLRQATKKVMHESLVMHFSSQILNIVNHLHSCKIIHADIKPDNFLLMRVPNSDTHIPSLKLIDFGCAIDMTLFPEDTQFKKVIQTDGFTCIEMQEGRTWSYQTDLFCITGTVHVMLFGEYMQLIKKFGMWDIKQKLPRYLKKHVWTEFFSKMLNIKDLDSLPNLVEMKGLLDDEVCKMDSELQNQIRTLSNLLHRR